MRKPSLEKGMKRTKAMTSKNSYQMIDGNILHTNDTRSTRIYEKLSALKEYKVAVAKRRDISDKIYAFFFYIHKINKKALAKQAKKELKAVQSI